MDEQDSRMDWAELLISGMTGLTFMSLVWAIVDSHHRKSRLANEAEVTISLEQFERERHLELRDMFDVSEPEWHILNEAAGEPDYHEQNKPLRRKVDDWSKYQSDEGHDSGEVEVIYVETLDGKGQVFYVPKPAPPPTTGQWTPPDWVKTEDVYHWTDWGSSSGHAN